MDHKNEMQKQRTILKTVSPCSKGLGGTVGHAFSHMHTILLSAHEQIIGQFYGGYEL